MRRGGNDAPQCPGCGKEMCLEDNGDAWAYGWQKEYWYRCPTCEWSSKATPTKWEAYAYAAHRYAEPNRVLTLDELKTYIGYAWYEGYHKWYHSTFEFPTWVEDGKYCYEEDLYDISDDVAGRFWLRKPTEEEMANTPWEEKQK